jgi:hypothetical protein
VSLCRKELDHSLLSLSHSRSELPLPACRLVAGGGETKWPAVSTQAISALGKLGSCRSGDLLYRRTNTDVRELASLKFGDNTTDSQVPRLGLDLKATNIYSSVPCSERRIGEKSGQVPYALRRITEYCGLLFEQIRLVTT